MNYNILIKSQSLPLLSIFIIYFLFIVPHFAEAAAISFDSANQINPANISDAEMTMTIAEANETLLCFAADDEITNVDTAVFDEQEMSNLVEVTDVKGFFKFWAFYLINPAIGTHTASFTRTTSTIGNEWLIHCSAYKNTAQSAPETYSIQSDSAITTHTANVTTLTPKAWTVMYAFADSGNMLGGSESILRGSILNTASALFDSNKGRKNPGLHPMSFSSTNGLGTAITVSLAPTN